MDRVFLKSSARETINGKIGILFLISIIVFGIQFLSEFVLAFIPFVGGVISAVCIVPAFSLSFIMVYLNLTKGIEAAAGDAFNGFYDFWSALRFYFFRDFSVCSGRFCL